MTEAREKYERRKTQEDEALGKQGLARRDWAARITVVLRPDPDGGFECVATEGVPYGVRISALHPASAGEALGTLCRALMKFRFDGEILLEKHTKRGRVRREVLK